jgi:predicted acyl esterase
MKKTFYLGIVLVVGIFFLMSSSGYCKEGVFWDSPVQGLRFETTEGNQGKTDKKGTFDYDPGESVTFYVGDILLGTAPARDMMTPCDLSPEFIPGNDLNVISTTIVSNMARFIQTLDEDGNVENGIKINIATDRLIRKGDYDINFDQPYGPPSDVPVDAFGMDPEVVRLLDDLNAAGVFTDEGIRKLRTGSQARNHLRRTLKGIIRHFDVEIPTRDGIPLLANVFLPIETHFNPQAKFPVIMNLGAYGKDKSPGEDEIYGCACDEEALLGAELIEDKYKNFGNPDGQHYENHESPETEDWVPEGYVQIRVNTKGVCKSPGEMNIWSGKEAEDYYDAIEWAGVQPWSNGNVGSHGLSYYGMNQWILAKNPPPSLKATLPWEGGFDMYRDALYHGGIFNWGFFTDLWWPRISDEFHCETCGDGGDEMCGDGIVDWHGIVTADEFFHPEIYDDMGGSGAPDQITLPFLSAMGQNNLMLHTRGNSEGFIHSASENKKLIIAFGDHVGPFYRMVDDQMRWYDYWLKGIDNGVMDEPKVKYELRTGIRPALYETRYADDWPIPGTEYTKYNLHSDTMILSPSVITQEHSVSYSAEVARIPPSMCGNPNSGVKFLSAPFTEDTEISGYIKMEAWVSSTSTDMEIWGSLRVVSGTEVIDYRGARPFGHISPIAQGRLKVSHRKVDEAKSTNYRPYLTHLASDNAPLTSGEVVKVEVEFWPMTALVPAGYQLRLDIQPYEPCGTQPFPHEYDTSFRIGATNTLYTGPNHVSYIQLPIIPQH